jgi:hypothetical protein
MEVELGTKWRWSYSNKGRFIYEEIVARTHWKRDLVDPGDGLERGYM